MTNSGPKRPLDFELPQHLASSSSFTGGHIVNVNNKRRCTNFAQQQSKIDNQMHGGHHLGGSTHNNSPFKDSSSFLNPLSEDISTVIKDEIQRCQDHSNHCRNNINNNNDNANETPILTIRQTHSICEKLIKDREQKLREEYDRILACKLAEQYSLLSNANYLNSFGPAMGVQEPRMPTASRPQAGNSPMNALAVAISSMQRSALSETNSATSLPDMSFAASLSANGHPSALTTSQLAFNLQQQAAAAALQAQQQRVAFSSGTIPSGPVLLSSNLDEQLATPEALFTLFGVFGDVIRVKILFNKKDNALIQMADANQAQVAQGYLDKQRIYGKIIRVTRSKHQLVQMPREGNQSDAGLTKDFTNSPLHRFKIPGSRNYSNIYPPSNTLHVSNIPPTIEEDEIRKAFAEACGFDFLSFKFFPKDRKMALMRFDSIENATIALIKMHNFQISPDNNLRVSFSKSIMQQ